MTTVKHGPGYSRFEGPEEKKVRRKYYLSDRIFYDPNRCIMCTRCVRFTEEVTKTGELGFEGRGFRKKIVVFPDKNLDNELAGNVTDLCPSARSSTRAISTKKGSGTGNSRTAFARCAVTGATSPSASTPGRGRFRG